MHPVLLKLGPVTLYSYGLLIALGFMAAAWVAGRRASTLGFDPQKIQNLALVALAAGILGARLTYVAIFWERYQNDFLEILRLDHGGLVFYGGLAAGWAALFIQIRRSRLPLWATLDLLTPPLALGHAFGRIGCFLNGCCYGKPSDWPWSVRFPFDGIARHPTQLYEALFLSALFSLLQWMERRRPEPGTLLLVYGWTYGLWRFGIEFLRGDNPVWYAGLTLFQWVSLPLVLFCGWMLLRRPSTRRSS